MGKNLCFLGISIRWPYGITIGDSHVLQDLYYVCAVPKNADGKDNVILEFVDVDKNVVLSSQSCRNSSEDTAENHEHSAGINGLDHGGIQTTQFRHFDATFSTAFGVGITIN